MMHFNLFKSENWNCLVIQSAKQYIKLDQLTKVPLGTQFNIDRQCQIFQGPNSFFCAVKPSIDFIFRIISITTHQVITVSGIARF